MYQPGYPQQGGYPTQQPGYPPQQPGYPPQQPGYPPQQPGYPPQQPGYPPQQPGYPVGQPGYPPQQPGFGPPPPMHPSGYQPAPGQEPPKYEDAAGGERGQGGGLPEFAGSSFTDKNVRRLFIRKVYLILSAQLLVTVAFIAVFIFVEPVKRFVRANSYIYYISYGVFLVLYIALVCCKSVRRSFPANFICLGLFTVALSYMTGAISSYYDTEIVLIAIGITSAVCISVTIFSMQTKYDFTKWGGILFVACMVLFIFGIVAIFTYNQIINTIYAALIALLFTAFLAYDTQLVMGGKKHEISPEEYITGALQIYLDVIYIFWAILALTGAAGGD